MADVTEPRLPRRRLAYAAMAGLLLMALGAFLRDLPQPNADLLAAVAYVLGGVVLGYFGAQAAPDVFRRERS